MSNTIRINLNLTVNNAQFAEIKELLATCRETARCKSKDSPASIDSILRVVEAANGQWITKSIITRRTQGTAVTARNAMLNALVEQGAIEQRDIKDGRGRPTVLYRTSPEFINAKIK